MPILATSTTTRIWVVKWSRSREREGGREAGRGEDGNLWGGYKAGLIAESGATI